VADGAAKVSGWLFFLWLGMFVVFPILARMAEELLFQRIVNALSYRSG